MTHKGRYRYLAPPVLFPDPDPRGIEPDTLLLAQEFDDAYVVLYGEYGGSTYMVVHARAIRCRPSVLDQLLFDVDAMGYGVFKATGIEYHRSSLSAYGRMLATLVDGNGLWLSEDLRYLETSITAILLGQRADRTGY